MKKTYLLLMLAFSSQLALNAQSWNIVDAMDSVRAGLSLVTLADGKVLAVGGQDPSTKLHHMSAEVYNPTTNSWSAAGNMSVTRFRAKSVLLNTGKVLVVGGYNKACNCALKTCELYNPVTNTFSLTGNMSTVRFAHTVTVLDNGKVLVVGGTDLVSSGFLATAELYDPATGLWTSAGNMIQDREFHTATLLSNGTVLVTGGNNWDSFQVTTTEVYDPASNSWVPSGDMTYSRDNHSAVKLATGEVLVTGGRYFEYSTTSPYVGHYSSKVEAEIYDDLNSVWNPVTDPMKPGMSYHRMILLNDGNVLSVAGIDSTSSTLANTASVTQLFNTVNQTWSAMPMTNDSRFDFDAVKLNNGNVFVAGGSNTSCEIFSYPVGISTNEMEIAKFTAYYSLAERSLIINSSVKGKENSIVGIYDVTGRKVKEEVIPANSQHQSISAEGLNKGIYIVRILNGNSSDSQKVVLY